MGKMRLLVIGFLVGASALVTTSTVEAAPTALGLRGGMTVGNDTFFMGGHVAILAGRRSSLLIEPSLELGVHDNSDYFTLRGNANFKYLIPIGRGQTFFYPLIGPSLYYVNPDNGASYSNLGFNLGFGIMLSGFSFELGAGIGRVPDLTLTIAYTFW